MFGDLFEDVKARFDSAMRLAVVGAILSGATVVAFICFTVALFLWVQQTYSTLEAWAAIGIEFFVIAFVALVVFLSLRRKAPRRIEREPAREKQSSAASWIQDPRMLIAGIQIVRLIGVRRLVPLAAVAAIAAGLLLGRSEDDPGDDPDLHDV